SDHNRRHLAAHDPPHQRQHLVVKDLAMLDRALQRVLECDSHSTRSRFYDVSSRTRRRFRSMRQPSWACAAPVPLAIVSLTYAHCDVRYAAKSRTDFASAACAPTRPVACSSSRARFAAAASALASSTLALPSSSVRQRNTAAPPPAGMHSSKALASAGTAAALDSPRTRTARRIPFIRDSRVQTARSRSLARRKLSSKRLPCSVRIAS